MQDFSQNRIIQFLEMLCDRMFSTFSKHILIGLGNMAGLVILLGLSCSCIYASQEPIFEQPLSDRVANYEIKAKLLVEERAVDGSLQLTWINLSADNISTLQFHLYLNGFKNNRSTFMVEGGGQHRREKRVIGRSNWGYIDLRKFEIDSKDYLSGIAFIQPDDQNASDQTVIEVRLEHPLEPGDTVRIDCDFYAKLPRVFARTGFTEDNFFFVAQWYPKIGVWENGQWNCHQFHEQGEFFADFGVYDMELWVPKGYVVGANGLLIDKRDQDSLCVYRYHQEDVTDAVWTAFQHFTEIKQTVEVGTQDRKIDVTYLFPPEKLWTRDRYFECVAKALNYFEKWIGTYPYPNLTIVEMPDGEFMTAGGMEYPTLVTTGSFPDNFILSHFLQINEIEMVTFHEIAHNYFQGILAFNEFEEPWLDEGFASYFEFLAAKEFFEAKANPADYLSVWGLPFTGLDYHRLSYIGHPFDIRLYDFAWKIPSRNYHAAAYSKPVLLWRTLENLIGPDTMTICVRTLFEEWKFKHPRTEDVLAVFDRVSGRDLSWFFDQFVYSNVTLDFQALNFICTPLHADQGLFDSDSGRVYREGGLLDSNRTYRCKVRVRNAGNAFFPTPILVRFQNGDSLNLTWDGRDYFKEFMFESDARISSVHIDPQQVNVLDYNLSNNARYAQPSSVGIARYTYRVLFWIQNFFQFAAGVF